VIDASISIAAAFGGHVDAFPIGYVPTGAGAYPVASADKRPGVVLAPDPRITSAGALRSKPSRRMVTSFDYREDSSCLLTLEPPRTA